MQGAHQAGDAGVDVHHRAAGEVERAPLEGEAGVGLHRSHGGSAPPPWHRPVAAASALAAPTVAAGPAQYQTMCAIGK